MPSDLEIADALEAIENRTTSMIEVFRKHGIKSVSYETNNDIICEMLRRANTHAVQQCGRNEVLIIEFIDEVIQEEITENKESATLLAFGVFDEVLAERTRQDLKWGEQNHDPFRYQSILLEEIGEVAMAINDSFWGDAPESEMRAELIQTAAVAIAFVECLDRGKWKGGSNE